MINVGDTPSAHVRKFSVFYCLWSHGCSRVGWG